VFDNRGVGRPAGFADVNAKPFTRRECRVVGHSGTGTLVSPPPIAGGEKHFRQRLADIGLERGELLPEPMMRSTEGDEIIKCVRRLGVVSAVRIDEVSSRPDVVDMKLGSALSLVLRLIDVTARRLAAVVVTFKDTVTLSPPACLSPLLSRPTNPLSF